MTQPTLQYETDRDRLRRLLTVFEENWSCRACQAKSAYWLEDCTNPLHALHEALWELDEEDVES
jgi:hypothetical protein